MSTYSSPALNGRRGVMLVVHPQLGTVSKTTQISNIEQPHPTPPAPGVRGYSGGHCAWRHRIDMGGSGVREGAGLELTWPRGRAL